MRTRYDRLVGAVLAAGTAACLLAVVAVRPDPLPPAAADRWKDATADSVPATAGRPRYAIDAARAATGAELAASGIPAVVRGVPFTVRGWVLDAAAARPADRVVFSVDGGPWRAARYHLRRDDVAAALGDRAATDSGFALEVPTAALTPGTHGLELATMTGHRLDPLPAPVPFLVRER